MNSMRALLVEDDCVINADIFGILEDLGIFVTSTFTADAAVAVIDHGGYLKILVTDVDLGEGLNGFDVARHARGRYSNLPVLFISGTMGSRHAAEGVAGSEFIAKPFHPSQIKDAIGRTCGLAAA
ncbi:response regulator [Phenylobacterium sp.]|jgi:CheY-like chemotaxis protein|uniref:response regulator n=1 Tax=Phenylobacterium sp. TaxID=1871053 RepID=UPI002E2F4E6B|nr:response regulator [Phenylobacterium sp.]HEX3366196.1 response regulator [Phenylobacterium sp.]